ncbi:glycosyl hydrolase family 88 [Arcticibacter pallidicorallinus]|uniref:Glycosyl hydrolase family 88 n=1 Tax=Arcticibacter pallidicorallinus TaxID=1259464 RepID=A0A2T0UBV0_9SPHI|nr:glycoside hydrolase family 88 protein [Arcticibacter pallidicorallinus]PRY55415.1 glycosyl hydrolase family 88 [Arcticibacter pallidicorallinus]
MRYFLGLLFLFAQALPSMAQKKPNVGNEIKFAQTQTDQMLLEIRGITGSPEKVSPRTIENGKLKMVVSRDWTSGFFPGVLWYLYDYTKDPKWLAEAKSFTAKLEKEQYNTGTHDLGFMIYCSFGNGYRLTGDKAYKDVIVQAAKSLSTRFNPKTGVIRSWDHNRDKWEYPVIIDNMMNLELLFEATRFSGDSSFYKIAVTHADNTLRNHFRPDYSSFHVVDYSPEDGSVRSRVTHQGYSDESAWARGQAWGLYGYIICYRETKDPRYLEQAKNIAKFIFSHPNLPKDLIPYWDFNDPSIPNTSRDASAAAITASALYELAGYTKSKDYVKKADAILGSLSRGYKSPLKGNAGFILQHSTGHRPAKSEIDVPINYADYYYVEALLRSKKAR